MGQCGRAAVLAGPRTRAFHRPESVKRPHQALKLLRKPPSAPSSWTVEATPAERPPRAQPLARVGGGRSQGLKNKRIPGRATTPEKGCMDSAQRPPAVRGQAPPHSTSQENLPSASTGKARWGGRAAEGRSQEMAWHSGGIKPCLRHSGSKNMGGLEGRFRDAPHAWY